MLFRAFRMVSTPAVKLCSLAFRPVFGNFGAAYKAMNPEKIRLNMAIMSDIHLDSGKDRIRRLHDGLYDLENAKTPNDVLACVGDTTDHGYEEHWKKVEEVFAAHKPAKEIFLVLGNHDTWTDEKEPKPFDALFKEYSEKISGRKLDKLYFSQKINGYTLISLASEEDSLDASISQEQINWFANEMELAAKDGKPIFVFMHQSINVTHGLPFTWCRKWKEDSVVKPVEGGIGASSDEIEAILRKYKNVFYFSGHIHMGLSGKKHHAKWGYSSAESDGSFHKINLPCFMFANHHGLPATGLGFQFEVYDDEVIMRPRSYASRIWYSHYDIHFTLE